MINEKLKKLLLGKKPNMLFYPNLNFSGLVELLENSDYDFIGTQLNGPSGMATHGKSYYDIDKLSNQPPQYRFFVILHEFGHMLRINKMGKEEMIRKLSNDSFDEFFEHIISEELFADRFASIMYYRLNGVGFPKYMTQQLDVKSNREDYIPKAKPLFGVIKDEESYDKVMKCFILEDLV